MSESSDPETPTSPFLRVHLINGSHIDSDVVEFGDGYVEEVRKLKSMLVEPMRVPAADGWELDFDRLGGGWAVVPGSSILWVEFVGFGGAPK